MAMTATASMTRSRRAEVGRHGASSAVTSRQIDLANGLVFAPNRPTKRQLDAPADYRDDPAIPLAKKARFAADIQVEIPARQQLHHTRQSQPLSARPAQQDERQDERQERQDQDHLPQNQQQQLPRHEPHPSTRPFPQHQPNGPAVKVATAPTPANTNAPPKTHTKPTPTTVADPDQSQQAALTLLHQQQQEQLQSVPDRTRKRPGNRRLKYELKALQPHLQHVDTRSQGRKLRSQEASRFKSELAAYFPEYDEVIGNEPKESHFLNLDTPIVLTEFTLDHRKAPPGPVAHDPSAARHDPAVSQPDRVVATDGVRTYSDELYTDLFGSQRVDFGLLESPTQMHIPAAADPLPDALYELAHRKAERNERSIRNSEKGRARHERDQIIRLLETLQGPDWLRTLGVSGITESRKKEFEPARDYFVKGCQAILKKFRTWAAEEKRLKLEKELAAAAAEAQLAEEGEGEEEEEKGRSGALVQWEREDEDEVAGNSGGGVTKTRRPIRRRRRALRNRNAEDLSDDDASIEAQLHELAEAAADKTHGGRVAKPKRTTRRKRPCAAAQGAAASTQPAAAPAFTSFFAKRYQRDAALGKNRRRGRSAPLAWGHPIPDCEEKDFELPRELQLEASLKLHTRRKRRGVGGKTQ